MITIRVKSIAVAKKSMRDYPFQLKFTHYTPLNVEREYILYAIINEPFFRICLPLEKSKYEPHRSKRCDYHKDFGHTTQQCNKLKEDNERWIEQGYLKKYFLGYCQQGSDTDRTDQRREQRLKSRRLKKKGKKYWPTCHKHHHKCQLRLSGIQKEKRWPSQGCL